MTAPPLLPSRALIDVCSLSHPPLIAGAAEAGARGSLRRMAVAVSRAALDAAQAVLEWQQRARERRQLRSLDDRMLRDLGLTRGDIQDF